MTIAFIDDLNTWASGWRVTPPDKLAAQLATTDVTLYTYPAGQFTRLGEP